MLHALFFLLALFFLQLAFDIATYIQNFDFHRIDFFVIFSFVIQSIFFLASILQTPTVLSHNTNEFALMTEETSNHSSSSSKRSLSPSDSNPSNFSKKSFLQLGLDFLTFVIDSGATRHLCNLPPHFFSNFIEHTSSTSQGIRTASNTVIRSIGEGSIGPLKNVLCMPDLIKNLFSVRTACQSGYQVLFHKDRCDIFDKDGIEILSAPVISAFLAPPSHKLYELKIYPDPADEAYLSTFSPFPSYFFDIQPSSYRHRFTR
jgi:hypothetical protein